MKCVFVSKQNMWSDMLYNQLETDKRGLQGVEWIRLSTDPDLFIAGLNPDWVFFFHWSDIIPEEIHAQHRCVGIHTSVLPDGKGGSPLQNQILEGIMKSRVNALAMVNELDSGPIYCSEEVTLQGSIFDIWTCIVAAAKILIQKCIRENITPVEQEGGGKKYKRRKDNTLPTGEEKELYDLYRFIQMLDGEGYPYANLRVGDFVFSFSRAKYCDQELLCDVQIRRSK